MFDLKTVGGIGEFVSEKRGDEELYSVPDGKVFLVVRPKTIEVRSDYKLGQVLREQYETVMESRYFGRGGIEIVPSGQLEDSEIQDLVRLSYNLTIQERDHTSEQ